MKTILIPTDFSENAHHALRFALYLSENVPFKICILHWTEILIPTSTPTSHYKELYDQQFDSKLKALKADIHKVLKSIDHQSDESSIQYILKDSSSFEDSTIEAIKENKVDLVIMGTHGASGIKKIFFGSNTTQIIDKAQIPVIAVPSSYPISPIHKIAYASDLKDVVGEVGELVKFASLLKASIEIFHVFPSFPQWVDPSEENIAKLTEQLAKAYPHQHFTIRVVQTYKENDVVSGIETYTKSFRPDIMAMFTVKRTFWDKLFDASRTEEYAFNATIPLLTLKKA
jgi:nucleotide-binding universal stress UspA family protein